MHNIVKKTTMKKLDIFLFFPTLLHIVIQTKS